MALFTIVNQAGFGNAASTNPLTSANFSSTTGNLLVCAVRAGGSTTISTVKNQAGTTFTALTAVVNGAQRVQFFYLKNITGNAADNIVVTFSGGNANNCAYYWEINGANIVAPSDVNTGGTAASVSTVTSSAFNTTVTDEIVLACAVTNSTGTFSAGSGFTLDSANGFGGFIGAQHLITTTLQSGITAAMTTTATPTLLNIGVASFRASVTKGMVQSGNTVGSGAPTRTIPFALNNQAGNLLVVTGRAGATAINMAVSDSQGNTWTILQSDAISSALQFIVAYAPNCKAGANTITISTGNANNFTTCSMIAAEFTGVAGGTSPVDVSNTVKTASASSTVTTNSITTTHSDLVLLTSVNETTGNPGYTPAGGFIQIQSGLNGLLAFNVPVAVGAIAPSSAIGTPVTWESFASSFFIAVQNTTTLTAATASLAATLVRQTQHALTAATAALAAVLNKSTGHALSAAMASFAATLTRTVTNVITLTASTALMAATLSRSIGKNLVASMSSFAATLLKQIERTITAATAALAATLSKSVAPMFAASMAAFSAVLSRSTAKNLTASMVSFAAAVSKRTSLMFSAATASFSASLLEGSQFHKALNAVMSLFSALLSPILNKNPFISRGPAVRRFGVNKTFPAVINTNTNDLQLFIQPNPTAFTNQDLVQTSPTEPTSGTADSWGILGQRVMAGRLLVAPGNGRLGAKYYTVVASGDITVPVSAVGATINLVLNQNDFSVDGQVITTISKALATMVAPAALGVGTFNWSLDCTLTDNGPHNSFLQGSFTIKINEVPFSGVLQIRGLGKEEVQLQLSLGAQFGGTVSGSDAFQIRATQFEIQQLGLKIKTDLDSI